MGEILLAAGAVTLSQIEAALVSQETEGDRIGEALVRMDACKELAVMRALGEQFGLPVAEHIDESKIQDELVERLPISP